MTERKIPVLLVTGFLGAGKTTFVNRILAKFAGKPERIALLINEFGSAGIDSLLVDTRGDSVYQVNRGSIFCSCVRADFVKAVEDICSAEPGFDLVIAEATGISETRNISGYLTEPPVNGAIYIEKNICLVDGLSFHKVCGMVKAAREQLSHADLAVLNKINLADSDTLEKQERLIREINPDIPIIRWDGGELSDDFILNVFTGKRTSPQPETFCDLPPENVVSVTVRTKKGLDRHKLESLINRFSGTLYRAKGIVRYPDGFWLVEWTMDGISSKKFTGKKSAEESFLVFIGKDLDRFGIYSEFEKAMVN